MNTAERKGALTGVNVLDLSRVAAGPYCTMVLADMGATVIKVERPDGGDDSRHMDQSIVKGSSGYYLGLNKNKRSIALDLKSQEGVEAIRALAKWADVVVENFRPGVMARLGLDYDDLRAINPELIYCSITAFGTHGPLSDQIGYDIVAQAMSGIMDITGEPDRPPAKCGAPIADISTGSMAAIGILAALYHRALTGEGQRVETPLIGGAMALLTSYLPGRAMGTPFQRVGSAHNTLAPYQAFRGNDDRYFIVAVGNDAFWRKLTQTIGATELAADESLATNPERSRRREELAGMLQTFFDARGTSEWVQLLNDAGVPASEIYSLDDVLAEPHYREIGLITEVDHPQIGKLPLMVAPIAFSKSGSVTDHTPPPALDEHGDEIRELIRTLAEEPAGAAA
jgi:crotonobetainyl-CoA:carnitine CoA-transferase CaiB-like acyl-CoA transferase